MSNYANKAIISDGFDVACTKNNGFVQGHYHSQPTMKDNKLKSDKERFVAAKWTYVYLPQVF